VGLLRHTSALYSLRNGCYWVASIFLLLAGMALARIKSMEQLRYVATGGRGEPVGIGPHPRKRADLPVFSKSRGGESRARPLGLGLLMQGAWAAVLMLLRTDSCYAAYGNLYSNLLEYLISAVLIFYILTIGASFLCAGDSRKRSDRISLLDILLYRPSLWRVQPRFLIILFSIVLRRRFRVW
jgi:hypothetical protein